VNLLLYHGVLAPRARWRSHVVRYGRPTPDANALEASPRAAVPTRAWTWAALMHRVFALSQRPRWVARSRTSSPMVSREACRNTSAPCRLTGRRCVG